MPTAAEASGAGSTLEAPVQHTTATMQPASAQKPDGTPDAAMAADGRRAVAMKLAERFALWSGAAGLIPVPFVDATAVGAVQI